jgi:hypothetical protein
MKFTQDLTNPRWMYLKALLFLVILVISFITLIFENDIGCRVMFAVLLVWSSARLYYFMFYVIEKYVDSSYKFSSVLSFLAYLFSSKDHH